MKTLTRLVVLFAGACLVPAGLCVVLPTGCTTDELHQPDAATQPAGETVVQLSFETPDDAVKALTNAAATNDKEYLQQIFGPEAAKFTSGDPERDAREREQFLLAITKRHDLRENPDGSRTILIGDGSFEFPVPIIKTQGRWIFDTPTGVENLENIRIGYNELRTIRFLRALPALQAEFRASDQDGAPVKAFARRLISSQGKHDGLFWPAKDGEATSPLGPRAAAGEYDYEEGLGYNGYLFKLLTSQGPGAPGGAKSYERDGRLTEGYAVLAYPAIYDQTGIKCFIANQDGTVYEKDLGDDTPRAAERVTTFDPTGGWTKVEG